MTTNPFDLNLRHLRAVGAIVQHGSMSGAAEAVSLSQPALTQGIAKLEAQLGVALFTRQPGGMDPTRSGCILSERVTAAFLHLGGVFLSARRFTRPEWLMTATQLRAFLSLADSGSFVGAAAAAGLSQPAIHRAVRDLEQVCGIVLADRRGRGTAMSDAGRKLARGIRLFRGEIAAAIAEIDADVTGVERGSVTIGAMPLSRAVLVPHAIAQVAAEMPGAEFDVTEGSWRELVEALRDGAIDVMIGALRPDAAVPDLLQSRLIDDRLVIVGRADHPLAGDTMPPSTLLARYPWIVSQSGTPLRALWETLFAGGTAPSAPIRCGSTMVIRGILIRSNFLTLLSPHQISLEIESGVLVIIGPKPNLDGRVIGVTIRRGWRPTRLQARFLEVLERSCPDEELRFSNA